MNKYIFFVFTISCILTFQQHVNAQEKYWINFKDKPETGVAAISEKTILQREKSGIELKQYSDLPINNAYLSVLDNFGIKILHQSKWLNSISAYLSPNQVQLLSQLNFIKSIEPIDGRLKVLSFPEINILQMHNALIQINAQYLIKDNLNGEGVDIGIIDVGFIGAKTNPALTSKFDKEQVKQYRDYVLPGNNLPYGDDQNMVNGHGTTVWKLIGGFDKESDMQFGLATEADYYLARTDHTKYEFRGEEDYWISAIEWMDSIGVKLVNTSLGYSLGFDDPKENYAPHEMDGKTTKISKAANIAAKEKGMLLVIAAGNEGNKEKWQVVSAPADAQYVFSVGATQANNTAKMGYSAKGPEFVDFLKPNISCYSGNGTSFSAPVISGLAACIWQRNPTLSNFEVMSIIEQSGNLYPFGNNYVGYGVPDGKKILALLEDQNTPFPAPEEIEITENFYNIPVDSTFNSKVVVFHKKNETHVLNQQILYPIEYQIDVRRWENCAKSTVVIENRIIEIQWSEK